LIVFPALFAALNEYLLPKIWKLIKCLSYRLLRRVSRELFNVGHPGHDKRTLMSDAEQRDIAEALFEPKQSREEIKDAIKLEETRRAAMVKNLYRLRSLRLSRNQASTPKREGWSASSPNGLRSFSAELFHERVGRGQTGKTPPKIDFVFSNNSPSMPRLNFSRPVKVHHPTAQFDI
jgi:hypothetical protein